MKVNLNNKNLQRVTVEKGGLCTSCYFRRHDIDCFEPIYDNLHGCFITSSYYDESNSDDNLFKL